MKWKLHIREEIKHTAESWRIFFSSVNKKNFLENTLKKISHFKMRILNMKKTGTEDDGRAREEENAGEMGRKNEEEKLCRFCKCRNCIGAWIKEYINYIRKLNRMNEVKRRWQHTKKVKNSIAH